LPIDQFPARGKRVLFHHKKVLMAMSAGIALLAGFATSAQAGPLDWLFGASPQRHSVAPRVTAPPPERPSATTGAREKSVEKEKPAAKQAPADLAAKADGVLTITISLNKQQLTLYSDGAAIARSHVSISPRTPTGVFSILQKDRLHQSDVYGDAPMYQRITSSGLGLYQGVLPARGASRGGIAMPEAFARQLWAATRVGMRVIITNGEVTPAAISNEHLFARRQEPVEAAPEASLSSAGIVESGHSALTGATAGRKGEPASHASKPSDRALDAMAYAAVKQREQATSSEVVRSAYDSFDFSKARRSRASHAPTGATIRPLKPGPISVFISRKEGKLFVRKGFEPVLSAAVAFAQPERPFGTHVFTALDYDDGYSMRWNVVTIPTAWNRPARRSRYEEQPSVGQPSSAAEALERITIPQEASDQIADLMTPGATLIISDEGLGAETGAGTDFTVIMR
jgi:hypothetical protein